MNFQTSKRIMCCLMAALILCCAVVRPIEVSAMSAGGAIATGALVAGIPFETGIAAILAALGIGLTAYNTAEHYDEIVNSIKENFPAEHIIETMSGQEMIEGLIYDDVCYVYQETVEWINDFLYSQSDTQEMPVLYPSTSVLGYDAAYSSAYESAKRMGWATSPLTSAEYAIIVTDSKGNKEYIWSNSYDYSLIEGTRGINVTAPFIAYNTGNQTVSRSTQTGTVSYFLADAYPEDVETATLSITSQKDVAISSRISALLDDQTYALWLGNALTLADTTTALPITLGETLTDTAAISQTVAQSIAVALPNTYVETDEIVYVDIPEVANDLSGIIALLKAILEVLNNIFQTCAVSIKSWINANAQAIIDANSGILDTSTSVSISNTQAIVDAISGIKFGDLSDILIDVKTAVIDGTTAITRTITDTIAEIIAKLAALGLTLTEILAAIQALATTIADAITAALTAVFVPSADFITAKVEALRTRFDWINPFMDFAKSLSFSGSEPPVIYIHLDAAEGSYYFGGTIPFLDMRWYSRYKATGDAIISGFLWMLFGWRTYLKLPGIISGVGGTVGHISR